MNEQEPKKIKYTTVPAGAEQQVLEVLKDIVDNYGTQEQRRDVERRTKGDGPSSN